MTRAVASAAPSIRPTTSTLVPRAVTMNTGNRLWISSDETSISKLTKPSAQMAAGRRGVVAAGAGMGRSGDDDRRSGTARCNHADFVHGFALCPQQPGGGLGIRGIDNQDHADAVVERAVHLVVINARRRLTPGEKLAARPLAAAEARCR